MSANQAIYDALRSGPVSEAQLRKATKLGDDEFDAELQSWRDRLWIQSDDSGKTPKLSITEQGTRDMQARYG